MNYSETYWPSRYQEYVHFSNRHPRKNIPSMLAAELHPQDGQSVEKFLLTPRSVQLVPTTKETEKINSLTESLAAYKKTNEELGLILKHVLLAITDACNCK